MRNNMKTYTNVILTIIAILLGILVFKVNVQDFNFIKPAVAQEMETSNPDNTAQTEGGYKTFGGISRGAEFEGLKNAIHEVAESNKLIAEALKEIAAAVSKSAVTKSSQGTASGVAPTETTVPSTEGSISVSPPKKEY